VGQPKGVTVARQKVRRRALDNWGRDQVREEVTMQTVLEARDVHQTRLE
jgi:hypothetical protein